MSDTPKPKTQQEAEYWRKQIASWSDEKLVRWIRGIARLKLRGTDKGLN